MTTKESGRACGGFTLIEVLVALVLLSIGLLGLEALGIHAAYSVAFAKRQSEFTRVAATELEEGLQLLRQGNDLVSWCRELGDGDRVSRVFQTNTSGFPGLGQITVTYLPDPGRSPTPPPVTVRGSVYRDPTSPFGNVSGNGCS